jgi:hypothetical protein
MTLGGKEFANFLFVFKTGMVRANRYFHVLALVLHEDTLCARRPRV